MPRSKAARGSAPKRRRKRRGSVRRAANRFVGRDASPVLDRYPPKDPSLSPRPPPPAPTDLLPSTPPPSSPTTPGSPSGGASSVPAAPPVPSPLITLDRPFDVDDFAALLGETSIRVTVPREALPEVLRRVTEFMGFGIYVYSVSVRPAPSELLKSFVVELLRVDYSSEKGAWLPFVEKGAGPAP